MSAIAVVHRFAAPARRPAFWGAIWGAVVAAELIALASIVFADEQVPGYRAVFRLSGGVFAACGLIGWRRRPDSHVGPLMVATGFGLLVEPVFSQIENPTLRLVGDLLEDAWAIPIIALLLTFLSGGRIDGTPERVVLGVIVLQTVAEVLRHLFLVREGNVLLVHADADLARVFEALFYLCTVIAALGTAVVIGVRFKQASPPRRRAMAPSVAGIACLLCFAVANSADAKALAWLAVLSLLLIPAAFLAGLLRSRLARGGVADLFGEIRTLRGDELQARLARAAGDPSLVLVHGEPPAVAPGRAVAPLEGGALVYDSALDEDPGLVEVLAAAASLALERDHSRATQQRLVAAGDAERRRLERDLHDGAQQRLVAVAMQLRMIQADIRRDPAAAEARVVSASGELASSLEELRALARGIHPAVLEHGLDAALMSLATRSAVPTAVSCDELDLPRDIELALYFVACEGLANVAKYAQARTASVHVIRIDGGVAIEVADDGIGGAAPSPGSGLHGLRDRVEAFGGHLRVTSPPGAGTVIGAELPCGS
ncbi:sensor histidine kinase [Solirubrobacter soli]|uniref:sensor histidine kinase n=1 Tax=Solirubrobacter soli TaxID=363832 RepID=UPI0004208851|nr:histidine kinase [Solirubrobacter soli]